MLDRFLYKNLSFENGGALCRSRRELSNEYLLAKFGFDTAVRFTAAAADNEPSAVPHPGCAEVPHLG